MSLPRLRADFIARRHPAIAPMIIGVCGAFAIVATFAQYRALQAQAAGFEAHLATDVPTRGAGTEPLSADRALTIEARAIAKLLATPWGAVLDDLEAAGRDSGDTIAVLTIQPDRDTHRVVLMVEARSMPAALRYVQRLQQSRSLAHPLLDSHEVRSEVAERPVRVQITADWKLPS
jgi:hypothetical protein